MPKIPRQQALIDRRNGDRANRVVAISHRLLKKGRRQGPSDWSLSVTKDMSHSGLLFLSDVAYRKGDLIEIHVVMSGFIDIYSGQAQVVRIIEKGETSFD
ncbi:MAG: hypothetical protein V2A70_01030, partial [Candidatus Omnitrophota bacterium]